VPSSAVRQRNAFRPYWPISIPQAASFFAIWRLLVEVQSGR